MRKIILILTIILLVSCDGKSYESPVNNILTGEHELRRFKIATKEGYSWSESYFLLGGGGSGRTYKETKVSFSWKMNTGEYAISEIEIGKIRVRIDSTAIKPYIKFNWRASQNTDLEYLFLYKVNYMVITCREEDYPININLHDL